MSGFRPPRWLTGDLGRSRRMSDRRRLDAVADCNLGVLIDLSATGARVRCRALYRPSEGSRVELVVPTDDGEPVSLWCVVCWTRAHGGVREAGLEFERVSAQDLAALARITCRQAHRMAA